MAAWVHAVVRSGDPRNVAAWLTTSEEGSEALSAVDARLWGLWVGRSGIGFRSDELIVSLCSPDLATTSDSIAALRLCPGLSEIEARVMLPTARPLDDTPATGDGVWVFRDFEVEAGDVPRFVELSADAWETFDDGRDIEIAGLFRSPESGGTASMLLVTRYADLATWEASRSVQRDPEAWNRFAERHELTRWTRARSATRIPV